MDKEELKKRINKLSSTRVERRDFEPSILISRISVLRLIDKLEDDKPLISGKEELQEFLERMLDERHFDNFCEVYNDLLDFVNDQLDEPYKPVIPDFVAGLIELQKEHITKTGRAIQSLTHKEIAKLDFDPRPAMGWINENYTDYCTAVANGYTVEKKRTYRFEQQAYMEQDFNAYSYEEAKEAANKEWKDMFEKHGLFGEPEYVGEIVDD